MSSTDSDMTKAIKAANKDITLESPPNLTSSKNKLMENLLNDALSKPDAPDMNPEHLQLGEDLTDFIMTHLLREIREEVPILV